MASYINTKILTKARYTLALSREYGDIPSTYPGLMLANGKSVPNSVRLPAGTRVVYKRFDEVVLPWFPHGRFAHHSILFTTSPDRIHYFKDRLRPTLPLFLRHLGQGVELVELRPLNPGGPRPEGPARATVFCMETGETYNCGAEELVAPVPRLKLKRGNWFQKEGFSRG